MCYHRRVDILEPRHRDWAPCDYNRPLVVDCVYGHYAVLGWTVYTSSSFTNRTCGPHKKAILGYKEENK